MKKCTKKTYYKTEFTLKPKFRMFGGVGGIGYARQKSPRQKSPYREPPGDTYYNRNGIYFKSL